jgi:hypothetical protein
MGSQGHHEMTTSSSPLPSPTWAHDLEELRRCVISRLSAIEDLARCRSASPVSETTGLVASLRAKIEELEEDRNRLRADAERGDGDWKRLQAQFEDDRRLLAEAWERLEHERVEAGGNPALGPARQATAAHRPRPADDGLAHPLSPLRTTPSGDSGNPVAEAILRQFQVLCGDVRRTTDARYSSG